MKTIKQQISLLCPCSWSPPALSLPEPRYLHPGCSQWPGSLGLAAKFPSQLLLQSSTETLPPPPPGSGQRHLGLPVATLWNGIQKFEISLFALVGRLGCPAQNSWERRNIRTAVGKITALQMTGCAYLELSILQTLTKVTRLFPTMRRQTLSSNDMPGEREGIAKPGKT